MKKIFLFFMLSFSIPAFAGYGWYSTNSNATSTVGGICMINQNKAIAVGFEGLIRTTTNGGQTWLLSSVGLTSNLHKVCFINESVGTIIGAEGVLLHTTNGGSSWNLISVGTGSNLNDIAFVKNGYTYTNTGFIVGSSGVMFKTTDGGSTWSPMNSGTNVLLDNNCCVNMNVMYATGYYGTVLKTTNGGINWTSLNAGSGLNYYGVSFIDENNGIICGGSESWTQGKVLKTTDGGINWTLKLTYPTASMHIPFYISNTTISVVGNKGKIFRSQDGGNNWELQNNQSPDFLYDVDFIDSLTGMAVGEHGTIVKTTTGGTTGITDPVNTTPSKFELSQNYPNPFNPTTNIKVSIIKSANYSLDVFDASGSKVSSVFNKQLVPGNYSFSFNGSNISSGVYFYKLSDGINTLTKKMLLVK